VIVALDAQLTLGTATGAGVYQRDLVQALRAAGTDVRALRAPWLDPWRFDRRVAWDQVLLPLLAARSGATVLHATSGTLPALRTLPTIVNVYDMAWLRVQGHTRAYARAYFGTLMKRLYRGADAIVTPSSFSREEFVALAGARAEIHVVTPGVDERFARIERRPSARPFALVVGTVERRKNLLGAIAALTAVDGLDIVAVGPLTPYAGEVRAYVREHGLEDRVTLRGYVEQAEIDALYAQATLALVPSYYEGFGYALAEALCAGLPVLAARTSSLVEVAASDATLIAPDDTAGWVDAIRAMLDDRTAAEERAAQARPRAIARFGWAAAAAACTALYRRFG
jgi:glycosyltransferase involved in cell wall biosynthesis